MFNWFNCYLSGRHEFGVWCEPGAIFLRCLHCGRRSSGWSLGEKTQSVPTTAVTRDDVDGRRRRHRAAGRSRAALRPRRVVMRNSPFSAFVV